MRQCLSQVALVAGQTHRALSSQTEGEIRIAKVLKEKFPQAASLKVHDISGEYNRPSNFPSDVGSDNAVRLAEDSKRLCV